MKNTTATTSRGTELVTTTETVSQLRRSQVIFPDWMENACAGLGDDDLVVVVREHAGFIGTFVRSISACEVQS